MAGIIENGGRFILKSKKTSILLIMIITLLAGFMIGMNIDNYVHNHDCLAAQAVYERNISNFREDIEKAADDSVLMIDEYRKFEFYIEMTEICKGD
ncbi:TPA: hypothetical protein QHU55_004814 [Klebsiella aerogenes]|nr:hypothetical protein [Klebsiella aerogenes]HDS7502453.1 hypothetical protein [Klebsiella aerogenes]HDS9642509.1 hypothetical protein [Klebsiella aerogenes]